MPKTIGVLGNRFENFLHPIGYPKDADVHSESTAVVPRPPGDEEIGERFLLMILCGVIRVIT